MSNFNFSFDTATDEDFFGNLKDKSSKLQKLFSDDMLPEEETEQSLKYQRPKANAGSSVNNTEANSSKAASQALLAKVVTAYRQGELQGKVGLALVQTAADNINICLYKSKLNVLVTRPIYGQQVLIKQNRYWQFYDEQQVYWSFSFVNEVDETEFQDCLKENNLAYQETTVTDTIETIPREEHRDMVQSFEKSLPIIANAEKSKNSLIKRMARMGQALPTTATRQSTTEFSDSSDTEIIKTPLSMANVKPSIPARNHKFQGHQQQLIPLATTSSNDHQQQLLPATTSNIYSISNPADSQYMQMLMTEQRTQGSELRMNINKLENKIEKVLDKLDYIERTPAGEKKHRDDEMLELEEKLLNLKKENRKLKQMLDDLKEKGMEQAKDKVSGMLLRDLRDLNIKETENTNAIIEECIKEIRRQNEMLQHREEDLTNLKKQLQAKQMAIEQNEEQMTNQANQLQNYEETQRQQSKQLEEKAQTIKQQAEAMEKLQENLDKHMANDATAVATEAMIKGIMNSLFSDICHQVLASDCGDKEKVLAIVGKSIKQSTLQALKQQNKPK